jgi:hypothetical protein
MGHGSWDNAGATANIKHLTGIVCQYRKLMMAQDFVV